MSVLLDTPTPPRLEEGSRPRGRTQSVLCAIDAGAISGDRVLSAAVALARSRDARLALLSVVRRPSVWSILSARSPARRRSEREEEALRWLTQALARVPADIDATVLLRHGDPADVIAGEAIAGHHAIVLGRRPRPSFGRRRGSVSAAVVSTVDVPIYVVPLPPTPEPVRAHHGAQP